MKCPYSLGEVNPGQKLKSGNINSEISAQLRVLVLENKWRVPEFGLVSAKENIPIFLTVFWCNIKSFSVYLKKFPNGCAGLSFWLSSIIL